VHQLLDSHLQVDVDSDYFELVAKGSGVYALQQYDEHGTLKAELLGGELKLVNADVIFYIISGWYATIITRSSHNYGDAATFTGLTRDPELSCLAPVTSTSFVSRFCPFSLILASVSCLLL